MSLDPTLESACSYITKAMPLYFSPLASRLWAPVEYSRPKDFAAAVSPLTANNMSGQGHIGGANLSGLTGTISGSNVGNTNSGNNNSGNTNSGNTHGNNYGEQFNNQGNRGKQFNNQGNRGRQSYNQGNRGKQINNDGYYSTHKTSHTHDNHGTIGQQNNQNGDYGTQDNGGSHNFSNFGNSN